MCPGYEEVRQRIIIARFDLSNSAAIPPPIPLTDLEILMRDDFKLRGAYGHGHGRHGHPGHKSLFKSIEVHPLEFSLEVASFAWERNKLDLLKQARCNAINILEPQYQRILTASLAFNDFVKQAKAFGGILDPATLHYLTIHSTNKSHEDRVRLALRAEQYAGSFVRDIPQHMDLVFRLERNAFKLAYSQLPRELMLARLNELLDSRGPYPDVIETFKQIATDMDAQYLEIRNARKALFEHDEDEYYGVEIDLGLNRCDEMGKSYS